MHLLYRDPTTTNGFCMFSNSLFTRTMNNQLNNNESIIPGLTENHFTCIKVKNDNECTTRSRRRGQSHRCSPTLTKAKVYGDGKNFYFCWTATSSCGKQKYYMQATGNIIESTQWNNSPKWWGFECRCSCKAFSEQEKLTIRENYMVNYVCDHLQSALEGSVDPKYCTEVTSAGDQRIPLQDIAIPRRENIPAPSDHKKVTIPGLAEDHFISEFTELICRSHPSATKVQIDSQSGDFDIHWKARGRGDAFYKLRAAGNIVELEKSYGAQQWWGFSVSCNCPNFLRQRHRCDASGWTENYVCQHLGRALESAIDKTYISFDDNSSSVNATFLVDSF